MNKIYFILLLFAGILIGCEPEIEDFGPNIPNLNDNIGAITTLSVNPEANFFNALNDLNSAFVEFTIDVDGFGVTEINSVDIEVTYTAVGRLPNPDPAGAPLPQVFDAVIVQNLSSFPGTVKLTAQDLAAAFGTEVDSFRVGDNFRAVFPINTGDGRRLTTAVSSDLCQQPAQPSFGGCNFDWAVSCPADLDGVVVDYEVLEASDAYGGAPSPLPSGSFDWQATGATTFTWDSYSFGTYQSAYGCCEQGRGSALRIGIICNDIEISAADGYGCGWELFVESVNGSEMVVKLSGENGGCFGFARVKMTRSDGSDWPPLF